MDKHQFIFSPGQWIGEGRISFSASPEHVRFYTKWIIDETKEGCIRCEQEVEIEGGLENVHNYFQFEEILNNNFQVELKNDLLGTVKGKGLIDIQTIAWEFRGHTNFEGFEVYELQENGDYMVHAEYASPDLFRTIIDGRVWKKSS